MKRVCIKVAGSERAPIDKEILPGTTAGDLLRDLNLEGYWLTLGHSGRFLGEDENVFKVVEDGDVLYCSSPAKVAL